MEIVKIPRMEKQDYDTLITEGYVSRIAFMGEKYPYIAPFLHPLREEDQVLPLQPLRLGGG